MSSGRQYDEQPTSRGHPQDQFYGRPEMVILLPGHLSKVHIYHQIEKNISFHNMHSVLLQLP